MPDDNEKHDDVSDDDALDEHRNARPGETVSEYKARMKATGERLYAARVAKKRERAVGAKETQEQERVEEAEALVKVEARMAKRGVNLARDIVWIYKNLGAVNVKLASAPSTGALELLKWVQAHSSHKKHFYSLMLPKAQLMQEVQEKRQQEKASKEEAQKRGQAGEDLPLAEVERLLREFAGEEVA